MGDRYASVGLPTQRDDIRATPTVPKSTAWEQFAAFCLGVYAAANFAQSISIASMQGAFRQTTTVLLPVTLVFAALALLKEPKRILAAIGPIVFSVSCIPGLLQESLVSAVVTPGRLVLLVLLPCIAASIMVNSVKLVKPLLLGIGVPLMLTSMGTVLWPDQIVAQSGRLSTEGLNTIASGNAAALLAVMLAWMALKRGNAKSVRVGLALSSGLLTAISLATETRASVFLLAAGFLLLAITRPKSRRLAGWAVVLAGGAIAAWIVFEGITQGRLSQLESTGLGGRGVLWNSAIRIMQDNPVGIGWGNYSAYTEGLETSVEVYPHNLVLQIGLEGGMICAVVFVGVLVVALVRLARPPRDERTNIVLVLLSMTLIAGLSSYDITGNRLFFVLLGASYGITARVGARSAGRGGTRVTA